MTTPSHNPLVRAALSALVVAAGALHATTSHAQIKSPGAHPKYAVELEPHLLVQWANTSWSDDGFGLGLRASIPVVDNGPVPSINNNLAIGFGLDWAHFDDHCGYYFQGTRYGDCTANQFHVPVVAQWNFFFTPVVSAFAELGLGIQHESRRVDCNNDIVGNFCNYEDDDTGVEPIFAIGPRFHVADSFALTLRVGIPYLSFGASFFL